MNDLLDEVDRILEAEGVNLLAALDLNHVGELRL